MPRSKKYKLRARERRRQVNDESQTQRSDEATAMEELPSCSSVQEIPSHSVSPTESGSIFQEFSGTSATTTTSPGTFDTSSDDGEESQDEENSYSLEVLSAQISGSASPTVKVDVVEQFLLHKYRVNQPILREDIEKILGENKQGEYAEILKEASERIEVVFAIELKEVYSTKHVYEFVSELNLPNNGRLRAGRGWPKTGLLMNILGLIFMKGNCATEEDVWQFLNMLKVYAGKKHFIYGEPRKLINRDLVKLKYLEYRQVPGSDPPRHEYLWGPRAYAETSKMKVLEFMAKAGDTVPSTYYSQYEEALRDKRARTRRARRAGTRARSRPDSTAPSYSTQSA
ncbi:melanoma-associated antigen B5-like [Rousettus aegyptiacus]|uniref:melanoma-associated antigen B5-like n=1 Tax=Rousettus aegyptiacus TaxID=9407 RepID=UPI00168D7609|nr:melanoma-associated antigen B5-like [Rousettus aegyptiacus]